MIASIGIIGGLCAFMYWVFNLMEKRIELKMDSVIQEVHRIADELREERRSKDHLYKFVVDNIRGKKE